MTGGGWSNLWSLSAQDRWSWFVRNILEFNPKSPPRLKPVGIQRNSASIRVPIHVCFRGTADMTSQAHHVRS
jgi:hypothetical protein